MGEYLIFETSTFYEEFSTKFIKKSYEFSPIIKRYFFVFSKRHRKHFIKF